jgi:hypothetical protein
VNKLSSRLNIPAAAAILLALLILPAPLLPPDWLADNLAAHAEVSLHAAYLIAALGLQAAFYGALGVLAAFVIRRSRSRTGRAWQMAVAPVVVIVVGFIIGAIKAGHLPVWINAVVPVGACFAGSVLGIAFLYRRWTITLLVAVPVLALAVWGLTRGTSTELSRATEAQLQQIVAAGPGLAKGDARFGAVLQAAFSSASGEPAGESAVQHNHASILAWGIAVGHTKLAHFAGLDPDSDLVRKAAAIGLTSTLQGRDDWPRHYALSAALALLGSPLVSDAAGTMKEQLDALTRGSGFSFGDILADRAGVRFASAATASEAAAQAMQSRLRGSFKPDDFFPPSVDLPNELSVDEFRRNIEGVGSPKYRQLLKQIELQLDGCAALAAR